MESKIFEELLIDLYDVYNTSKKKDVERLVNSYNGREFDAIKTILVRYNYKGHPGYNENANRDEYVTYLINKYSNNERPLSKENRLKETESEERERIQQLALEEEQLSKKREEQNNSITQLGEEVKNAIKEEIKLLKSEMEEKLKTRMDELDKYLGLKRVEFEKKEKEIKKIEYSLLDFSGQTPTEIIREVEVVNKSYTKVNIENLNFTDSDIKLPSEDILETLAKGTRLILENSEGRVCGVEVKDITFDLVSYDGEVVKEIILEKI